MLGFGPSKEEKEIAETKALQRQIHDLELEYDEKLNPAHEAIARIQGSDAQDTSRYSKKHQDSYNELEVVNRGVNMIVDAVSEFSIDVKDKIEEITPITTYMRPKKLNSLLNFKANEFQSASELKRLIAMDIVLEGNAFVYFDGDFLYILPAINVEIVPDAKRFIKEYIYDDTTFSPEEIIHIRDNAADSIFRGSSRLTSAVDSISILDRMNSYQDNFFKNNTILGVVLKTPDMLSRKVKNRKILDWMRDYNPVSGGRKPLILDGGFDIEALAKYNFKELDFAESILTQERKILEALGVPPILLQGGNNANIAPNLKLFYTNTILPIMTKIVTSFELFFGFDLKPVTADILALRPELRDQANYETSLVNAGIITRNESRQNLRYEPHTGDAKISDALILPANIAGSAENPGVGGKPPKPDKE